MKTTNISSSTLSLLSRVFIALVVAVAISRVIFSYSFISQTMDEAVHIAAGMEWIKNGTYQLQQENPPLSRIAIALGPYLAGVDAVESLSDANKLLSSTYPYPQLLYISRLGNIVFFLSAIIIIWLWTNYTFNRITGIFAVAFFTTLPPVLAHAGLATTDMAAVATTIGAVFALALWLDQRSVKRDAWLGIALGLLILTKFSAVLFVFASAIGVFATRWLSTRSVKHPGMNQRLSFARLGVPLGVMAVLVWAGYQFSVGPIRTLETRPHEDIDRVVGTDGPLHDLVYDVIEAPIYPASEMIGGLGQLLSHNQQGHVAYLLGEKSQDGFWYFFPVAFAVKTPLPFLVFIIVGAFATIRMVRKDSQWLLLVPLVSSLAILISVLPTSINIGLRHILPIYAMLSIVAAVGVAALTSRISRTSSTMMAAALLLWYIHASVAAHPSYLSYFNELAGPNPEHIIVDSDLDWGQDIGNLAKELKNRDIKTVHLALFTAADLSNFEWPEHTFALEDHFRAEGWIAASLFRIKVDERLEWLENYEPVAKIGSSIHLYYIPGSSDG